MSAVRKRDIAAVNLFAANLYLDKIGNRAIKSLLTESTAVRRTRARRNETRNAL
jgi:hypothetical protein